MKKYLLALLMLSGVCHAQNIYYSIERVYHPANEPAGLYIVHADIAGDGVGTDFYAPSQYRVYCPTNMVRDITDGVIHPSRTAWQEDRYSFGGKNVIRAMVAQVCGRFRR